MTPAPDNAELALRRLLEASECLDPHDPTTAALVGIGYALLAVADKIDDVRRLLP